MFSFANFKTACQPQRVSNSAVAATGDINCSSSSMTGFQGIVAEVLLGAITATGIPSLRLQHSLDDGATDPYADIAGSKVTGDATMSNLILRVELTKPTKKFVRAVVGRATATIAVDAVIVHLFHSTFGPPTQHSTETAITKVLTCPASGTA